MNTLTNLGYELLGYIQVYFNIGSRFIFDYKMLVFIPVTIMVILFRFVMANVIHVKRHDNADWVFFGIMLAVQILTLFVAVPWIWMLTEIIIVITMVLWKLIFDKARIVKTVIYSNNIVYEDNSEKYDNKSGGNSGDNKIKEMIKRRDVNISRRFTKSRAHMRKGIPVLTTRFIFKVSPMATEEQLAKAVSYLNRFYDEYNWRKQKASNGIKYEFTAELKINKISAVDFDKDISDDLDWYMVPMGAIDVSSKATAKQTPYVWMMHDPKTEGKVYKSLAGTKLYSPSPHAFVVGQTGGGKSVLLNTMIAHWVNKGKTSRQVELYLCDAKRVEFRPYESLDEVVKVAVTLKEAVDLTNDFCKEMHMRNTMMEKEGIKNIPLDGKIKLNRSININGHIIYGSDIIEFKTADGKIHKDRALNLNGRKDIVEVNIPSEDDDKEKDEDKDDFGGGW